MNSKAKVVVLLSGGMDSVSAFYDAMQNHHIVAWVSFNYGSKHNDKEIPFAAYHCRNFKIEHHVIHLDFIGELFKSDPLESGGQIPDGHYVEETMKNTVVPFRNGIMLSIAAGFCRKQSRRRTRYRCARRRSRDLSRLPRRLHEINGRRYPTRYLCRYHSVAAVYFHDESRYRQPRPSSRR